MTGQNLNEHIKSEDINNRVAIFGSHKGLGFECTRLLLESKSVQVLGFSRKDTAFFESDPNYIFKSYDFTKLVSDEAEFSNCLQDLKNFNPTHVLYVAGGGPYGNFFHKSWKDHEWAFKLNFTFPAKLLWTLGHHKDFFDLQEFLYVGSEIAESSNGDPLGPSYAAGKWAMKGLFKSIQASGSRINLNWISPGYMDTDLLPQGSTPRLQSDLVHPKHVAEKCIQKLGLNLVIPKDLKNNI